VVDAYTRDIEHRVPIHPEHAESVLDQVAADDAVFTVETGMCNVWAARYITRTAGDASSDHFCTARWPTRSRTPSARSSHIRIAR
jgi:thiamine pyrophosphate-dependent acetolactate synthase large subunit-like protein